MKAYTAYAKSQWISAADFKKKQDWQLETDKPFDSHQEVRDGSLLRKTKQERSMLGRAG